MTISTMNKVDAGVVIARLWQSLKPGTQMYSLLDAARGEALLNLLKLVKTPYCSLFTGKLATDLAAVAPYLVQLDREAEFTNRLVEQGWGESWGIFLGASATLTELQEHFRQLLLVKDEAGRPLHFRYYDPRVLRLYLPTCNAVELRTVFGPISNYQLEDENKNQLLYYSLAGSRLDSSVINLT